MHLILTGKIDSGKSTYVLDLARRLIDAGRNVSGWITPAHMEDSRKVGHDFVLIECGKFETPIPFTRLIPFEGSASFPNLSGPGTGKLGPGRPCTYHFNRRAFERAAILADRSLQVPGHRSRVTDVFIMDEIGPLELEDGEGFIDVVRKAIPGVENTLAVVRQGLAIRFAEFVGAPTKTFALAEREGLEDALGPRL